MSAGSGTTPGQAGFSLLWFRLNRLQSRIKLNHLRAGLGQKLTSSWGTSAWCQNRGHWVSTVLRLLGTTEGKEKASDNRDVRWGLYNSAVGTILEKVKLLSAKIFRGWHENTPAGLCPFLLTEPSVAITWEFCSGFLVTIYGVSLKNSEPINTRYWWFCTEKNSFLTALKDFTHCCSWIPEIQLLGSRESLRLDSMLLVQRKAISQTESGSHVQYLTNGSGMGARQSTFHSLVCLRKGV